MSFASISSFKRGFLYMATAVLTLILWTVPVRGVQASSHEIRGVIDSFSRARQCLKKRGVHFLSAYAFTDFIFLPLHSSLKKEYWRIRVYHKTAWKQKAVNLTHKKKASLEGGMAKAHYQEFDSFEDAQKALPKTCHLVTSYKRNGIEYQFQGFHIFLENIDSFPPSVEVVSSEPRESIKSFMGSIGVKTYFTRSVPELMEESVFNLERMPLTHSTP